MSNALATAPAGRPTWTSGRAATLVALAVVALAVAAALLLVPVAPRSAAGAELTTANAAESMVREAHAASCPGVAPPVSCAPHGEDWHCSWGSFRDVLISRTPRPAMSVGC